MLPMKPYIQLFLSGVVTSTLVLFTGCATDRTSTAGTGPSFKGPIGLQLYSLRAQFGKDVPGTLDEVQKMGFKYAELAGTYGVSPSDFKAQLAAHGIEAISGHFGYEQYRDHFRRTVCAVHPISRINPIRHAQYGRSFGRVG